MLVSTYVELEIVFADGKVSLDDRKMKRILFVFADSKVCLADLNSNVASKKDEDAQMYL
jgi:hypothetical protein